MRAGMRNKEFCLRGLTVIDMNLLLLLLHMQIILSHALALEGVKNVKNQPILRLSRMFLGLKYFATNCRGHLGSKVRFGERKFLFHTRANIFHTNLPSTPHAI